MPKVRVALTLDEVVMRLVRARAARQGKSDGEVIEEALRRDLGPDLLERIWSKNHMNDEQALSLGIEAQNSSKSLRRR